MSSIRAAARLRRALVVVVSLGSMAFASTVAAVLAPSPQFVNPSTTPASDLSWDFAWAAVPPDTPTDTITYEYCASLTAGACASPTSTAGTSATVVVTDGPWFFNARTVETGLTPGTSAWASVAFTADTTALPPTIVTGPASGALINAAPTYTLAGEPGATFEWSFTPSSGAAQTGTGATAAFTQPVNPLEPVTWTFSATQTDPLGNESLSPATRTFTIDRVAPADVVITPAAFGIQPGNLANAAALPTLAISSGGGDPVTFQYRIDGDAPVAGTTVNLASIAAEGAHTVSAWAFDAAGNRSVAPDTTISFIIDRLAPLPPSITGPLADGAFTATVPSYTLGGSEAGATYLWSLTGPVARAETAGTAVNLGVLGLDGLYTVNARTRDAAGNLSGTVTRTFTLDRVNPAAPTISPDILDITNTPPDVTIAGGGEPVTYRWRLDGGTVRTGAAADLAGTADGQHVFEAWAVDRAGNESAKLTRNFTLDRKAPDPPTISEPPAATNRVPRPTITGPARTTVFWTLTGPRTLSDDGPTPVSPNLGNLPDGEYTLQAYVRTPAGNRSGTVRVTFRLDTDVPAPPIILSGPTSPRGGPRPQFTWTGEQGGIYVWQVMRNDLIVQGPARTNATGVRVATLSTGKYTLRLSQIDAAGNQSEQSAPWEFEIRGRPAPRTLIAGTLAKKRLLVKSYGPLNPRPGRVVLFSATTELRWIYRSGRPAKVFNIQIFDENGAKILSRFPTKPQFTVPRRILKTGKRYYWQIWPYWGKDLGYAKRPLGVSYFDVRPSAAQLRAAAAAAAKTPSRP